MVLIFAKNLTSSFPFCFNIFLLLLYLHFNILLLLSYFLYLLYTVNQFSFTHFRYCVSIFSYKHMPQCKFSLYLKKAGLASRNMYIFKKSHSTLYRSLLSLSTFNTALILALFFILCFFFLGKKIGGPWTGSI